MCSRFIIAIIVRIADGKPAADPASDGWQRSVDQYLKQTTGANRIRGLLLIYIMP